MAELTHASTRRRSDRRIANGSVLIVPGGAPGSRLLDLALASVPDVEGARLHVVSGLDPHAVHSGEAALRLLFEHEAEPGHAPVERTAAALCDAVRACGAERLVIGYPADASGRARFADVVARVRGRMDVEVIVCWERHTRRWHRLLLPFLYAPYDNGALAVARRLAQRNDIDVTILHVVEPGSDPTEDALHLSVQDEPRCSLKVVIAGDPVAVAAREARDGYDAVIVGSGAASLRDRQFTTRQQRLLLGSTASLVIVYPRPLF